MAWPGEGQQKGVLLLVSVKKLTLTPEGLPAWLCLVDEESRHSIGETILHETEKKALQKISSEKGCLGYLTGRYAAKKAFQQAVPELQNLKEMAIVNGALGQPVILSKLNPSSSGQTHSPSYQVSISHAQGLGGALVFPETHPMGLDIEPLQRKTSKALEKRMSQAELSLVKKFFPDQALLYLWTMKESLSKVLRTGLSLDLKLLEVKTIKKVPEGYESSFTHFPQYKTLSHPQGDHIISITQPL